MYRTYETNAELHARVLAAEERARLAEASNERLRNVIDALTEELEELYEQIHADTNGQDNLFIAISLQAAVEILCGVPGSGRPQQIDRVLIRERYYAGGPLVREPESFDFGPSLRCGVRMR